jgi:hypothetical protein
MNKKKENFVGEFVYKNAIENKILILAGKFSGTKIIIIIKEQFSL